MTDKEKAEFEKRKTDAEKKLSEMYYSSGQKDPKKGLKVPSFITPIQSEKEKENKTDVKDKPKPKKSNTFRAENILNILNWDNLKMDNDRMLILAIILLLAGDSGDELLMISLLYILL